MIIYNWLSLCLWICLIFYFIAYFVRFIFIFYWFCLIISKCYQIWFSVLKHGSGIYGLKPIWVCLIIEILVTWGKFLQLSGYCTIINFSFPFHTTHIYGGFCSVAAKFKLLNKISQFRCMFILVDFKSNTEWSNAQCVSGPSSTILPPTTNSFHSLNCFSPMINAQLTSTYQNMIKTLTVSCIFKSLDQITCFALTWPYVTSTCYFERKTMTFKSQAKQLNILYWIAILWSSKWLLICHWQWVKVITTIFVWISEPDWILWTCCVSSVKEDNCEFKTSYNKFGWLIVD